MMITMLVYYAGWLLFFIYYVRSRNWPATAWDDALVAVSCALWPIFLPLWITVVVHKLADAIAMHERNWQQRRGMAEDTGRLARP